MKKRRRSTKRKIKIVLMVLVPMTTFIFGFGIGSTTQDPCQLPHVQPIEKTGEARTYEPIFYDGEPRVDIVTEHQYINMLSESTLIITDKSLDDIQQEILDSMDYVEVE